MALDKNTFKEVTGIVIDKLEGGYWNPAYHGVPKGYENSGETMFGIDRKYTTPQSSPQAGAFWALIDANKNPQVWKWNYRGGALEPQLKDLTGEIMYNQYIKYANAYMAKELREIVEKDPKLLFHFIYAAWNGVGWFNKFAADMNNAVKNGVVDSTKLVQVAIDSRTKEGLTKGSAPISLIKTGGDKIKSFIDDIPNMITKSAKTVEKAGKEIVRNPVTTIILTAILIISIYTFSSILKTNTSS